MPRKKSGPRLFNLASAQQAFTFRLFSLQASQRVRHAAELLSILPADEEYNRACGYCIWWHLSLVEKSCVCKIHFISESNMRILKNLYNPITPSNLSDDNERALHSRPKLDIESIYWIPVRAFLFPNNINVVKQSEKCRNKFQPRSVSISCWHVLLKYFP